MKVQASIVATGIPPAVEGGILPAGIALKFSKVPDMPYLVPPGETPGSTAGGTPAATFKKS